MNQQQQRMSQSKNSLQISSLLINGVLQRKCSCGQSDPTGRKCKKCEKKRSNLQRKAANHSNHSEVPSIVSDVLHSPGQALAQSTREFMEPRFGHDFSQVRVHLDGQAAESARAVNASAYTVGNKVVFGAGQYAPGTNEGKNLLVHELSHVVQQNSTGQPTDLASVVVMPVAHPAEREAHKTAQQLQTGSSNLESVSRQGVSIQRQADGAEEEGLFDRLARGVEGVAERVTEGVEAISEGILRGIRCSLPATENPVINPLSDMSTFQSPGGSGWRGAKFGCFRNNCSRRHRGWDIHAPVGTSVRAVVEGTVTHHQNPGGFGDFIRLHSTMNPDRNYIYAHLSQREPVGNYCVGDELGETGVTGNASANRPHLHFEVRTNNAAQDPASFLTDPTRVVEQVGSAANAIDTTIPAPCVPC